MYWLTVSYAFVIGCLAGAVFVLATIIRGEKLERARRIDVEANQIADEVGDSLRWTSGEA